jgi:hypothetical protein
VRRRRNGWRTSWAHLEFTRINIPPTVLPKKTEDLRQVGALKIHAIGERRLKRPLDAAESWKESLDYSVIFSCGLNRRKRGAPD